MDDECLNVDLLHFALNEFLSDLILLNGNKEYRYNSFNISSCHKVVICACSDYFYKKFKQDEDLGKVNNQVKLTIPERMETYGENFDDIALPLLIKFCYSKENFNLIQKEINPSNVFSFISIAHCLGMKSFLYHLENFISDTMINVNHCACLLKESYKV